MTVWAIARFDLGLTDAEYFALAPLQFAALLERWLRRERRLDSRAGEIAAAIYNAGPKKTEKPVVPSDFFGSLAKNDAQSADEMAGVISGVLGR